MRMPMCKRSMTSRNSCESMALYRGDGGDWWWECELTDLDRGIPPRNDPPIGARLLPVLHPQ